MEELLNKLTLEDTVKQDLLKQLKEQKIYLTELENADKRYSKFKEQKSLLEAKITELESNEDSKDIIAGLEATIEQQKKEYTDFKKNTAVENILKGNNAKHIDLLKGKFDLESLEMDDKGNFKGLDDQLKAIKETYADLFEQVKTGFAHNQGNKLPVMTKEQFNKLSYSDRCDLYTKNKELYLELSK